MKNALRISRFALGVLNLAALVWLFTLKPDPIEPSSVPFDWLAPLTRIQFGPAVLSLDVAVLCGLLAVTLLFGRFYCEVICPLGVAQDVVRKLSFRRNQGVRRVCCRLPVSRAQLITRSAIVAAVVTCNLCGGVALARIDPYGIFGRAATLVEPLAFVAVIALVFIGKGRIWCNWVCPVGSVFAAVARFSWGRRKTTFDSHCKDCRACWPVKSEAKTEKEESK